jgi:crossover junction endodeoxyribonuclease RuvC
MNKQIKKCTIKTILGIDPGSRITGFGVIRSNGLKHAYVTSGCIRMTSSNLAQKLQQIYAGIQEVILTFSPDEVAIEEVFMAKNPSSALKLGHARGVAIVAASLNKIAVAEYSTRQIKQTVVGYGAASKVQIQHMVKATLKLSGVPQTDAADALAVAICHAQMHHGLIMMAGSRKITRGRIQ